MKVQQKRNRVKRFAVIVAVLLTAWHLFATFLWIAPRSELREVVPGDMLREYMNPLFGQSWSVFAPTPISADYYFDVRAVVATDEGTEVTDWLRATDAEQSLATYNLFPPRAAQQGIQQARAYRTEWQGLESAEQEVAGLNFFEGDKWADRLEETMLARAENADEVKDFIAEDRHATAYATQVALAVWGDDVLRIQFKTSRQEVVAWSERNNPEADRSAEQSIEPGWRGRMTEENQSREKFAEYFCNAPLRVCDLDGE